MKYRNTLAFTVLTPILIIVCAFLAGGGHGYYGPSVLLFPLALLSFSFSQEMLVPFMVLGVIQFPIYGLLLDILQNKRATMVALVIFHLMLAMVVFYLTKDVL